MEAIILYKTGKRIGNLQRGLRYENMEVESKIWDASKELDTDLLNTNLVILHCDSPDNEILALVLAIRRRKYSLPLVVVDETYDEMTEKKAIELGADVYHAKPFIYRTLATEWKKLICKKEMLSGNKWLRAYDIWLDLEHHFVKRSRKTILLRNKEFALLEFFIINRGKVLNRHSILEHVWDRNAHYASNTVDVHINRLRRKIDDPFQEKLIHTVPCVGYLFEKKKKE